ncbi:MAG: hypothetical protein V3U54_07590 [Thermodesulfobacteriota bacterium]
MWNNIKQWFCGLGGHTRTTKSIRTDAEPGKNKIFASVSYCSDCKYILFSSNNLNQLPYDQRDWLQDLN